MKTIKFVSFISFLLFLSLTNRAQNTVVNSEIGVFLGPTFFQGDFGEAESFESSTVNVGTEFQFAYIMDFSNSRYYSPFFQNLADHIKEKLSFSYAKIKLEHSPIPVPNTSSEYTNFKNMYGETKIISFGIVSEIYLFSISDQKSSLEPYLTLGLATNIASPTVSSSSILPTIYTTGNQKIFNKKQNALSFSYGLGTRYRLDGVDLVLEGDMHNFLSDKIDGLDPEVANDKSNDSMVSFRFGAIFRLDNSRGHSRGHRRRYRRR